MQHDDRRMLAKSLKRSGGIPEQQIPALLEKLGDEAPFESDLLAVALAANASLIDVLDELVTLLESGVKIEPDMLARIKHGLVAAKKATRGCFEALMSFS